MIGHSKAYGALSALRFAVVAAMTLVLPLAAEAGAAATSPVESESAASEAEDMLQSAYDALADRNVDRARSFFQQILEDFPTAPQAVRAKRELADLDADDDELPPNTQGRAERNNDSGNRIAVLRRAFLVSVGDRVFFAENSASIGGRARAMIENQARWLKRHDDIAITIIGRADDAGTAESAKELSERRAQAVKEKLLEFGIAAERVRIEPRGDTDRIAVCRSFMCQAQNRNVETMLEDHRRPRSSLNDGGPRSIEPARGAMAEREGQAAPLARP